MLSVFRVPSYSPNAAAREIGDGVSPQSRQRPPSAGSAQPGQAAAGSSSRIDPQQQRHAPDPPTSIRSAPQPAQVDWTIQSRRRRRSPPPTIPLASVPDTAGASAVTLTLLIRPGGAPTLSPPC